MGAGFAVKAKANQSAEILIYEDVGAGWFGGVTAKQFTDELKALGDVKSIDVRINSYGGDVFEGLAIYRQLVGHAAKVTTHIDGVAASIASVIAMAGEEIRIAEAGWLMVHDAWGGCFGNAAEMRRQADLLDSVTAQLAGVYEARTQQPMDKLRKWMADETWMNAADALDNGFATSVSENLRMAAYGGSLDRFNFRHLPAGLAVSSPPPSPSKGPTAEEGALRAKVTALAEGFARRRSIEAQRTRGAG